MADDDFPSKEARLAYVEAKRLILEWRTDGDGQEILDFSGNKNGVFGALERIPPTINSAQNLRTLLLNNTQVRDLTPISRLQNLEALHLDGTQVSDLTPISRLQNLQSLYLGDTKVSDLTPISSLQNLQSLYLSNTQVSDLKPISGLQNLQSLYLGNTQVSDLTPISSLQNLQSLYLGNLQVSDLTPISRLQNLQSLSLTNTQVSDLTPISGLQNLQSLYISDTKVSDLTPISSLQKLRKLNLSSTQVSDLTPVSRQQNLQSLYLSNTQVSDLTPISGLQNLQTLDLDNTQVSDLMPMSGLQNLQLLYLDNTQVSDLKPISGLQNLQSLYLDNTQVSDLKPISGLQNLQSLYLSNTQVSDLTPLSDLRAMAEWATSDDRIPLISGLNFQNCPNLMEPYQAISKTEGDKERTLKALNQIRKDARLNSVEEWLAGEDGPTKPIAPNHKRIEAAIADAEKIMELAQERVALRFGKSGEHLKVDLPAEDGDAGAAADPLTQQLHEQVKNLLPKMADDVAAVANRPDMREIGRAYDKLCNLLDLDTVTLAKKIVPLWGTLCEIGGFLEQDDDLRLGKAVGMEIEASARRKLMTLIRTAGPLARRFPTGALLDEESAAYLAPAKRYGAALQIAEVASSSRLLTEDDIQTLKSFVAAIDRGDVQIGKRRTFFTRSGRNLVIGAMGVIGSFYLGAASDLAAEDLVIAEKAANALVAAESAVLELLSDAPPDIRLAAKNILENLKQTPDDPSDQTPGQKLLAMRRNEDDTTGD